MPLKSINCIIIRRKGRFFKEFSVNLQLKRKLDRMKSKFLAFIALVAATLSLSSCLSSDETVVEYTNDTAITSFSLGKLGRYTKTTAGKDTLIADKVNGANYKFYIDQATRHIYNVDSLPTKTRTAAVLATISSKNSSPIFIMNKNCPEKIDSAKYYSSTDSIDFSQPRMVRVYNNSLNAYVTYTVKVNVHQQEGNEFNWQAKAQLNEQLAALSDLKVLALGSHIYVFGKTLGGMKIYKSAASDGNNWAEVTANQTFAAADYQNAVQMGNQLYILSDGKVYASADAATWSLVSEDSQLKQLVGASSKYLYAFTATGIAVSKDNGATWAAQKMDADLSLLPTQNLSMNVSTIASVKNVENVLLLGTRDASYGDTIATLWNHVADYSANASESAWNYIEYDAYQSGKMPMMDQVLVCGADSGFVALGSNGKWYKSKNNGLTWGVDTLVTMPAGFSAATQRFGFCRDKDNFYWVVRNGSVWKGRFNKDAWIKDQTIFE